MKLFACLNFIILLKFLFFAYVYCYFYIITAGSVFWSRIPGTPVWEADSNLKGKLADASKIILSPLLVELSK
jgi:hypothetical protein